MKALKQNYRNAEFDDVPNLKTGMVRRASEILSSRKGAIGYLIAWLLGVPASILIVVYLVRALF